jgi:hypothetical protein
MILAWTAEPASKRVERKVVDFILNQVEKNTKEWTGDDSITGKVMQDGRKL